MEKTIKEIVLKEAEHGNIVLNGLEGLTKMSLAEFIKQPIEGILYDLNRSPEVILTFIDDPKWINDYAAMLVISELKRQVKEKV